MEHEAGPAKKPGALPDASSTLQESPPVSAAKCIIEHALSFGLAGPLISGFFALIGISIIIGIAIGFQELTSYLFFGSYYSGAVPAVLDRYRHGTHLPDTRRGAAALCCHGPDRLGHFKYGGLYNLHVDRS